MTKAHVPALAAQGHGPQTALVTAEDLSRDGAPVTTQRERIGRYTLDALIAVGGMASVYLGSLSGAADFSRVVAIKRMHPPFSHDPDFVARFRDEAWICARLSHPSIVQTFDVVEWQRELLLIMEFVEGVTLHALRADVTARGAAFPIPVALGILVPVLHGLHAAHEATDDEGHPLQLVHRDVSPHNLLVSREGHAKVLDFGIAKARGQLHATSTGQLSGKFGYLSPEQIHLAVADRRADVFSAGIVLWETLTGKRLFREPGVSDAGVLDRVLHKEILPPSHFNPEVSSGLDAITLTALTRDPAGRFESARAFALALEDESPSATPSRVAELVQSASGTRLARLAELHAHVRRRPLTAPHRALHPLPDVNDKTEKMSDLPEWTLTEAPQPRRRLARRVAALAAVLLMGVAAVPVAMHLAGDGNMPFAQRNPSALPGDTELVAPRSAQSAALASGAGLALAPVGTNGSSVTALPSAQALSSGSAGPRPLGEGATPRGAERRRHEGRRKATQKPARNESPVDGCSPPTYVDSDGIRHFKKGCL